MAKSILISSGKGGVGKSTIAAILGIELSNMGYKVLVFDYDTGLRNMDILYGLQSSVVYNVIDYLQGDADLSSVLIEHPKYASLFLLSTSQYAKQRDINMRDLTYVFSQLEDMFDFIIIDSPAGVEKSVKNALKLVDLNIVVATCDNVSMRDAEKVLFEINKRNLGTPYLLLNKVNLKLVKKGAAYSPQSVAKVLDMCLIGYVEEDPELLRTLNKDGLPNRSSKSFLAVNRIARRLVGEDVPMPSIKKGIFPFWKDV